MQKAVEEARPRFDARRHDTSFNFKNDGEFDMKSATRLALAALALPLTLAACGSEGEGGEIAASDALDPIPAPEGTEWTQVSEVTELGGVRVGNPDAPLKLVEYASHTCGACANFAAQSHETLESYIEKGILSLEQRNQVHNIIDITFATLAFCGDPGAYQPLSRQAWSDVAGLVGPAQANEAGMTAAMQVTDDTRFQKIAEAAGLVDWFAARGLSRDKAMQCLSGSETPLAIAERSETQSNELGVTGTPTFFLNGNKLEEQSWADLQPVLERAGAR